jgi:methylisocitrate lyase
VKNPARELRQAIKDNKVLAAPGVIDGMTARIAASNGFKVLFMTGAGVAASIGVYDGLATLSEITERARVITRSTDVPLIVDADSGGTTLETLRRTVIEIENAGAAGLIIEDQIAGMLKVAHVYIDQGSKAAETYAENSSDRILFTTEEMSARIAFAKSVRQNPDTLILARTDVMPIEGIDAAIARSNAYGDAGADLTFVQQPKNLEETAKLGKGIKYPLMINTSMINSTGATLEQLGEAGVRVVLYTNMAMRMGWHAINKGYKELATHGTYGPMLNEMMPYPDYLKFIDPVTY